MGRPVTSKETDKLLKYSKKALKGKEKELPSVKERVEEKGVKSLEWRTHNNKIKSDYLLQKALKKLMNDYKVFLNEKERKKFEEKFEQ